MLAVASSAEDSVELPSIQAALATATTLESSVERDSAVEPVAFHRSTGMASRNPYFYGSAEMLFLDINADTGGRITASFNDNTTVGTEISFNTGTGVQDEFGIGARTVIGRQFSDKWGIAARYFHLEDTETGFPRLTPGTTPLPTFGTYTETDTLKMYSIDLEAVRSFNPGKTKIDTTFGGRQASLDVDSLFHAFGVITTGNFVNLNLVERLCLRRCRYHQCLERPPSDWRFMRLVVCGWSWFEDVGPQRFVRPFRWCGCSSSPSAPLVGAATVTRNNAEADLVTLEAQTGVQFEFALEMLPATAFFRVGAEYQDWDINGPPTGGAGFGGTIGDLTTNSFSAAGLGDTELVGGTVAMGFTW